jgi:dihydroxy-acid dehydratase
MPQKAVNQLRSQRWITAQDLRGFGHRSRLLQIGYDLESVAGCPVIGILNTWSDINPCHAHLRTRAEEVKRGVLQAGGFPLEIPVLSLAENFMKPTTMLYRNFLAMEAEEVLVSYPIDGAILLGGCDKTVPGLLMGALSANLPALFVPAGPMLRGNWRGQVLGSGSDVWKYWAEKKAGRIDEATWAEMEEGVARSFGTCMTMGTASTLALLTEALGLTLPGASTILAADSGHPRMATAAGRAIVDMVWHDRQPRAIVTDAALRNALVVNAAIAGSTNAVIHLIAIARRAGRSLSLEAFDAAAAATPVIANLRPSGRYLMEDLAYAGGARALLARLAGRLDLSAPTANGRTLGDNIAEAEIHDEDVIRPLDRPVAEAGGLAVLRGNLAPEGCVMKPTAAEPRLLRHTGPALVFDDYPSMAARIDAVDLDVSADTVLVLRNAGPVGGPGMPEWGMLPIPRKLLEQGVRDMVRISDARMSGTSYGACILHVSPEAQIGGPLASVKTGDLISVDVPARRIHLHVSEEEIAARLALWSQRRPPAPRGWLRLHAEHIRQAHEGCDYDFLDGVWERPEPEIF